MSITIISIFAMVNFFIMSTYREAVYLIRDEIKKTNDDSIWENEHLIFLLEKYRAVILKQKYSGNTKKIPSINYQPIKVKVPATTKVGSMKLPHVMDIGGNSFSSVILQDGFTNITLTLVSPERYAFVGENCYLSAISYCTVDYEKYFRITSTSNTDRIFTLFGILDKPSDISEYNALFSNTSAQDILDIELPLEESLLMEVINYVLKDLGATAMFSRDKLNNATDDAGSTK